MSTSTHPDTRPSIVAVTPPSSPKEGDTEKKLTIRTSVVSKTIRKLDFDHDPEKSCEALRNEVATGLGVPDQLRSMLVLEEKNAPKVLSGDTDSLIRALDVDVLGRYQDDGTTRMKYQCIEDPVELTVHERADGTTMLLRADDRARFMHDRTLPLTSETCDDVALLPDAKLYATCLLYTSPSPRD